MNRKNLYCIIIFTLTLGAIIETLTGESVLAKKPDEGTYEIQLQTLTGETLHEYDWGVFALRQSKSIECNLVYLGNTKARITWKITDLQGWSFEIWDISESKPKQWVEGSSLSCKPGETWKIRVILKELNAVQKEPSTEKLYFFTLSSK